MQGQRKPLYILGTETVDLVSYLLQDDVTREKATQLYVSLGVKMILRVTPPVQSTNPVHQVQSSDCKTAISNLVV